MKVRAESRQLRSTTKSTTSTFKPSMEMKENVDSLLMLPLLVQEALATESAVTMYFDCILELNAPLCQTHVVLFARYWVSPNSYRLAAVWGEPHRGDLNYPIYPPTLNIVSDSNQFAIRHQIQHMYDGMYRKPVGERGPFVHRFNVYPLSDIRFAEQEALDLRVCLEDIERMTPGRPCHEVDANETDGEWVFDVPRSEGATAHKDSPVRMKVRSAGGRIEEVSLLAEEGKLLKRVQYESGEHTGGRLLTRQTIVQPERTITVGFAGKGPTITINGERRQYSQLETVDLEGGRKWVVDYQPVEIRGCTAPLGRSPSSMGILPMNHRQDADATNSHGRDARDTHGRDAHATGRHVALPSRIEVYTGDGKQLLRRVRMSNVTACEATPEQVCRAAERFSLFDPNELQLRALLIKYWLKAGPEIGRDDIETLQRLRRHFAQESSGAMTTGEQLKCVNMLLETDWMLDDPNGLEEDFREYIRLLRANDLGRMVLFGGENLVETTARLGQPDAADTLLPIWLDAAVAENDMSSILGFVSARLTRGSLWTSAELLEKALSRLAASREQQFVGRALRCIALSQIDEMVHRPDYVETELGVAQVRWVLHRMTEAKVREELTASLAAARTSFDALDQPTRQDRSLKQKLDTIEQKLLGDGSVEQ